MTSANYAFTQHNNFLGGYSVLAKKPSPPKQKLNNLTDTIEQDSIQPDENQIDASSVAPSMLESIKTFYTTYTYFTTLFRNGTSFVTSNLETVTNTADATASPTLVQPR